jgi:hypothetical protein
MNLNNDLLQGRKKTFHPLMSATVRLCARRHSAELPLYVRLFDICRHGWRPPYDLQPL